MCGLSGGMSSTLTNGELNRIKMLMVLSTFRGMYGSGAIVVHPGKKKTLGLSVCRTECCAAELICDPSFTAALSHSPKIVVAHARAPTKGGNELKNVHPHRTNHITGVHNGTMWQVMGQKIGDDQSDSAAIFAAIAEFGVEAFMKESRGAYSLVWTDTKEGTLNFLRNEQRPLVFANIGWGNRVSTVYWSSEMGMLEYMLKREKIDVKDVKFESPKAFQHIKFPLDVRNDVLPSEIKQYSDPLVTKPYTNRNWHGYEDIWDYYDDTEKVDNDIQERIARQKAAREEDERRRENLRRVTTANLPAVRYPRSTVVKNPGILPPVEDILKAGSRRTVERPATFRTESDSKSMEIAKLLRGGPCCICDNTPEVVKLNGALVYPKVYPVQFGSGWPQYICQDCVRGKNPIALSVLPAETLQ
jgi:hypothetical protein